MKKYIPIGKSESPPEINAEIEKSVQDYQQLVIKRIEMYIAKPLKLSEIAYPIILL